MDVVGEKVVGGFEFDMEFFDYDLVLVDLAGREGKDV